MPALPSNSPDAALKANILIAYPYWNDQAATGIAAAGDVVRLVIDSGAFTAWKAGKPIALDDYCRFLEGLPVNPWRYFTLDVIGDPAGSMRNYETMLKRGFNPVPIFTRGEDVSVLDDYYKTSDLVGVGGLVGTQDNKGFVNGIMRRVAGRKVHWLGFTQLEYLKFYRPYMCDSSSWESGGRYGAIRLYMGNGRHVAVKKADYAKPPSAEVAERIRHYGFDPLALRKRDAWHGGESLNRKLSVASALALSLDIHRNLGTLMFNAIADTGRGVRFFVGAFNREMSLRSPQTVNNGART